MATSAHRGQAVMGQPNIIPNVVVDAPNGTGYAEAGDVIPVPTRAARLFFGVVPHKTQNAKKVNVGVYQHYWLRKKAGEAWLYMSELTLVANATGTLNDFVWQLAIAGDEVHGYAMEAADIAATEGWVLGPFMPPYQVKP